MRKVMGVSLDAQLWERVDSARGDVPRSVWVRRLVEAEFKRRDARREMDTLPAPERARLLENGIVLPAPSEPTVAGSPVLTAKDLEIPGATMDDALRRAGVTAASAVLRPAYGCPVAGCDFRAPSSKAVCGAHGRTVKEVAA